MGLSGNIHQVHTKSTDHKKRSTPVPKKDISLANSIPMNFPEGAPANIQICAHNTPSTAIVRKPSMTLILFNFIYFWHCLYSLLFYFYLLTSFRNVNSIDSFKRWCPRSYQAIFRKTFIKIRTGNYDKILILQKVEALVM